MKLGVLFIFIGLYFLISIIASATNGGNIGYLFGYSIPTVIAPIWYGVYKIKKVKGATNEKTS